MNDDHMLIKAQIEQNMAEFQKISEEHEAYLKQKAGILEEAKKLGLDPDAEIPWDQLPEDQKSAIERIRNEREWVLKELQEEGNSVPRHAKPRGIPI